MRVTVLAWITCTAALVAGGADAQQVATTYSPVYAAESYGGAEHVVQTTRNDSWDGSHRPKPVYAVVAHHIVSGTIQPGSRLLDLVDASQSQFTCHVFHRQSQIALACTDGSLAQVSMTSRGCGHSRGGETASLCIGLPAQVAAQRLTASPGERLTFEDGKLTLKPAA